MTPSSSSSASFDTPPLGPHIVIGHDFPTKVTNPVAAMRRGLFAPIEMISTATKG
ncbi:MAG TPA: hypothetical protein VFL67_07455 [Mycobacterium sp.]|nr:hypothetical protein [Mycobacterium sp.]